MILITSAYFSSEDALIMWNYFHNLFTFVLLSMLRRAGGSHDLPLSKAPWQSSWCNGKCKLIASAPERKRLEKPNLFSAKDENEEKWLRRGFWENKFSWEFPKKKSFKAFNSSSINGNKGMSLVSVSLFSGVISIVIKKLLMVADET